MSQKILPILSTNKNIYILYKTPRPTDTPLKEGNLKLITQKTRNI